MDMLGHEHVPNQCKSVPGTNLIQNLYEAVARTDGSEIRPPPIATEGDEMQVARSIKSPQRIAFRLFHARQVNIRTLKTEGCGTRPHPPAMTSNLMVYSGCPSKKKIPCSTRHGSLPRKAIHPSLDRSAGVSLVAEVTSTTPKLNETF